MAKLPSDFLKDWNIEGWAEELIDKKAFRRIASEIIESFLDQSTGNAVLCATEKGFEIYFYGEGPKLVIPWQDIRFFMTEQNKNRLAAAIAALNYEEDIFVYLEPEEVEDRKRQAVKDDPIAFEQLLFPDE